MKTLQVEKAQGELLTIIKALNKASYNMINDIIQNPKTAFCLSDVKNINRKIESTIFKLFCLEIKEATINF